MKAPKEENGGNEEFLEVHIVNLSSEPKIFANRSGHSCVKLPWQLNSS